VLELNIMKQLKGFTLDAAFSLGDELVAIFGPSGAGKSLTLQCVAGLMRPDAGRIALNGRPLFDSERGLDVRPQERRIGYVFQHYALMPHLSVAENIAFGLHRLPKRERAGRVEKMVASMRLEGLESRRPAELSGGQQQRVAVARALATEPELLLLDEPFSALDSPIRSRLHGELLKLLRGLSITTVLVTHNLAEAYTLSEKMVVYNAGRVLQVAPRDEVLRRPASRTVARFTGVKNIYRGVVARATADLTEVRSGDALLIAPPGPHQEGADVDLCIRPEEVMLIRPDRDSRSAIEDNRFSGEVVGEVAHGTSFTLLFRLDGDPFHLGRDYDLHLDVPANVYYRLEVDTRRQWTVSLKKESIHLMPPEHRG
jgi:molybdate transport system ATP-binding protein